MRKKVGFFIALMAIIGGLFAVNQIFFQKRVVELPINKEAAGQFASAFVSSYFSYSNLSGFESIQPYTDLHDRRKPHHLLQKKEVIAALPLHVNHLQGGYMKAQVLLNVKDYYLIEEPDRQREEVKQEYYSVSVSIMQNQDGYKVLHYPAIERYSKPQTMIPPYPPRATDDIESRMRPFLDSFFRTFFVANQMEELNSFFTSDGMINPPLGSVLEFISLEQISAYGEEQPWLVFATVNSRDSNTQMEFLMTYEMIITNESNKFVIQQMMNGGN